MRLIRRTSVPPTYLLSQSNSFRANVIDPHPVAAAGAIAPAFGERSEPGGGQLRRPAWPRDNLLRGVVIRSLWGARKNSQFPSET
jgi:hypothetical protein